MGRQTLCTLRREIEALADTDGTYVIVCGRTGDRPVPTDGCRFDSRAAARAAVRLARRYRNRLRRYDSRLPYHDLIVVRQPPDGDAGRLARESSACSGGRQTTVPEV